MRERLSTRRSLLLAAGAAALLAFGTSAAGQTSWPNKPITLIVPFAAGSLPTWSAGFSPSGWARPSGNPSSSITVRGLPGSSARKSRRSVPPTATTLFLTVESIVGVLPHLYRKPRYDPFRDFTPVTQVVLGPYYLVTAPEQPFQNLQDLLASAKAKPDGVTYGSLGVGSGAHMRMVMLSSMTGVSMLHVPYKGSPLSPT